MTNNYKINNFTQFLEIFKNNQENDFDHFKLIGMDISSAEDKKNNPNITTEINNKCRKLIKETTQDYYEQKISQVLYNNIEEKIQKVQKVLTINKSYNLYLQQITNPQISIKEKKSLNILSYDEIIVKSYNQNELLSSISIHIKNILNKSSTFLKFQENSNSKINETIIKNPKKLSNNLINIMIDDLNVRGRSNLYPMTIYQLLNCSEDSTIEELSKRKEIMKKLALELKYYINHSTEDKNDNTREQNIGLNMYYTQLENLPIFRTRETKIYYDNQISKLQKDNYKKVNILRKIYWWFLKKINSEKHQEYITLYNLQQLYSNVELKENFTKILEMIQDNIKEYNKNINIVYEYKDVDLYQQFNIQELQNTINKQLKGDQDKDMIKKIEQNIDTVKQKFFQNISTVEKAIERLNLNYHNLLNKDDQQTIENLTDNIMKIKKIFTELKNDKTKETNITSNTQIYKAQHTMVPKIH